VHALLWRERGREEHALEHPHRALPPGRGRDPALRRAGPSSARRATRSRPGSAWSSSTSGSSRRLRCREIVLGEHREEARRFVLKPRARSSGAWPARRPLRDRVHPRARSGSSQWRAAARGDPEGLYREARILILDEPTAVLTPQEAEALFATLRTMAAEGRT
jgi:hypothetical protein